jgi:hypothetical protein
VTTKKRTVGYIVRLKSADGLKLTSIASEGRTRGECIQNAVDQASTRDGMACRALATTSIRALVNEIEAPSRVSPRRIYVSPKPKDERD